ncbi:MAG: NAD(P)H-dependent oxidoreductase [Pseudomonadota bacterium]
MKLLGISGSLRAGSYNSLLVREAARLFGEAEFTMGDLRLPLYDGDVEASDGVPPEVQRLGDQIAAADAIIVSTPEYNQAMSGVLKNALDWVSRVEGSPWRLKPVALLSAAAGRTGGARAQFSLRLAMVAFQPRIVPAREVMVGSASKAFGEDGRLSDELAEKLLTSLMADLRSMAEG